MWLPDGTRATISDTVGFVHKLPPILVAAFRATLDEVVEADLLLQVVDVSSPYAIDQMQVVSDQLSNMGVGDTPKILVLNKLDLVATASNDPLDSKIVNDIDIADFSRIVTTSAIKAWGIKELRTSIEAVISHEEVEYFSDLSLHEV